MYERLIVVTGMPHSGTTIFTYILKQHPDIQLLANTIPNLLESWFIDDINVLDQAIATTDKRYIMVKRPALIWEYKKYLLEHMPNARFLYCLKSCKEAVNSWNKVTSVGGTAKDDNAYEKFMENVVDFEQKTQHFKYVCHASFVNNPIDVLNDIVDWLDLKRFNFDVSQVDESKNIKHVLGWIHPSELK